jgi:hypothetical protein
MIFENEIKIEKEIIEALKSFGELDWYKYGPILKSEEDLERPHVTVWRYKNDDKNRDQLIVNAIESFRGKIQWAISFRDRESLPGRNWWIEPKDFQDFLYKIKDNTEIIDAKGAFAAAEPEIGKAANREIPDLAEHIKKVVQKGLGSKVLT